MSERNMLPPPSGEGPQVCPCGEPLRVFEYRRHVAPLEWHRTIGHDVGTFEFIEISETWIECDAGCEWQAPADVVTMYERR